MSIDLLSNQPGHSFGIFSSTLAHSACIKVKIQEMSTFTVWCLVSFYLRGILYLHSNFMLFGNDLISSVAVLFLTEYQLQFAYAFQSMWKLPFSFTEEENHSFFDGCVGSISDRVLVLSSIMGDQERSLHYFIQRWLLVLYPLLVPVSLHNLTSMSQMNFCIALELLLLEQYTVFSDHA